MRLIADRKYNIKFIEKMYTILSFCMVVFIVILMYVRCFYGTELSDEAYYISEAKEILNGNIPFSYNNSSKAVGFTFLLIPIVYVCSLLSPDLEGIVLTTRLCFVTLKLFIAIILFFVLIKNQKKSSSVLLVGGLFPIYGFFQNFNYNNVPIWLLILSGILLYDVLEQESKHRRIELVFAGFVSGIAIFANPGWGLTLFIFGGLICKREKRRKEKIDSLLCYFGAILIEVFIVVMLLVLKTSLSELWYGFYRLFIFFIF